MADEQPPARARRARRVGWYGSGMNPREEVEAIARQMVHVAHLLNLYVASPDQPDIASAVALLRAVRVDGLLPDERRLGRILAGER